MPKSKIIFLNIDLYLQVQYQDIRIFQTNKYAT